MTLVLKSFYVAAIIFAITTVTSVDLASACTPGIPCTSYVVDSGANAWKGKDSPLSEDDPTCDGDYMNQMIGEAWMHATREVAMNAQIVKKPDSILEYTCFDQFPGISAVHAGPIFSETAAWAAATNRRIDLKTQDETKNIQVVASPEFSDPGDHVDKLMEKVIYGVLKPYINNNFAHKYLGDTSNIDNHMGLDKIGGGGYNCTEMSAIWNIAKCINFAEDDRFLSFGQLVLGDPRQAIVACKGRPKPKVAEDGDGTPPTIKINKDTELDISRTYIKVLDSLAFGGYNFSVATIHETDPCPAEGDTGLISKDLIRLSNNCDFKFSAFDVAKAYFEYTKTIDLTFPFSYMKNTLVYWTTVKNTAEVCGPAMPTGVKLPSYFMVEANDIINPELWTVSNALNYNVAVPFLGLINFPGINYEEHVCPNPACSYVPVADICIPPT